MDSSEKIHFEILSVRMFSFLKLVYLSKHRTHSNFLPHSQLQFSNLTSKAPSPPPESYPSPKVKISKSPKTIYQVPEDPSTIYPVKK